MSVSRLGYYKWKYRKQNPILKEISRQSAAKIIKEVHEKQKAHGYRGISHVIRNSYEIYYTDNYVHHICKYENIKEPLSMGKIDEEQYKLNNLIWNGWSKVNRLYKLLFQI